ncbi:MAG: hypothetical protein PHH12_01935 [Candidatus Shapirobacteria bacterium]|nr:hypothetical protein [Candidatus Shapirobacteria bacterium]
MKLEKIFYWLPRILSVLFIVFISMFALDVFEEAKWFLALLIHLIPSFILIILTVIAWKNEKLGGMTLIIVGVFSLIYFRFESLIISIPIIVIGMLFWSRKYFFKKKYY